MKKTRNFKTVVIMLCIAGVIVLAYAVQGFYFSGPLTPEDASLYVV